MTDTDQQLGQAVDLEAIRRATWQYIDDVRREDWTTRERGQAAMAAKRQVDRLLTETKRSQAELATLRGQNQAHLGIEEGYLLEIRELQRERDRLRAVVEAARNYQAASTPVQYRAAVRALYTALAALDAATASPEQAG